MRPEKRMNREEIFKGNILEVVRDTVEIENGNLAVREVVLHNGAAGIVAVDNDGKLIFVRQYRYSADRMTLEIAAGKLEKGEDPEASAIRELEEETGLKAKNFSFLTKFYSAIGFCTEILYIYIAENLYPGTLNLDEDEFVELEKYTLDEAVDKIFSGEIIDSKTIASVLAYKEFLNRR